MKEKVDEEVVIVGPNQEKDTGEVDDELKEIKEEYVNDDKMDKMKKSKTSKHRRTGT